MCGKGRLPWRWRGGCRAGEEKARGLGRAFCLGLIQIYSNPWIMQVRGEEGVREEVGMGREGNAHSFLLLCMSRWSRPARPEGVGEEEGGGGSEGTR